MPKTSYFCFNVNITHHSYIVVFRIYWKTQICKNILGVLFRIRITGSGVKHVIGCSISTNTLVHNFKLIVVEARDLDPFIIKIIMYTTIFFCTPHRIYVIYECEGIKHCHKKLQEMLRRHIRFFLKMFPFFPKNF